MNLIVRALSAAFCILQHSARCHSLGPLWANGFCLVKSVIQCLQLACLYILEFGLCCSCIPLLCIKGKTQGWRCAQGDWRIEFFPIAPLVKQILHQMVGFQTVFESSKISALKVTRSLLLISPKPLPGLDSRFTQFFSFVFFQRFVDILYNKWRHFFNQFAMYDPVNLCALNCFLVKYVTIFAIVEVDLLSVCVFTLLFLIGCPIKFMF